MCTSRWIRGWVVWTDRGAHRWEAVEVEVQTPMSTTPCGMFTVGPEVLVAPHLAPSDLGRAVARLMAAARGRHRRTNNRVTTPLATMIWMAVGAARTGCVARTGGLHGEQRHGEALCVVEQASSLHGPEQREAQRARRVNLPRRCQVRQGQLSFLEKPKPQHRWFGSGAGRRLRRGEAPCCTEVPLVRR